MKQEMILRINEAIQNIRISNRSGSHLSCIRLNPGCSDAHNMKIVELSMEFLRNKIPFYTEAILLSGGRPDIFLPATSEIYEIMHTETDEMLEAKIKKYPSKFKIIKIRV